MNRSGYLVNQCSAARIIRPFLLPFVLMRSFSFSSLDYYHDSSGAVDRRSRSKCLSFLLVSGQLLFGVTSSVFLVELRFAIDLAKCPVWDINRFIVQLHVCPTSQSTMSNSTMVFSSWSYSILIFFNLLSLFSWCCSAISSLALSSQSSSSWFCFVPTSPLGAKLMPLRLSSQISRDFSLRHSPASRCAHWVLRVSLL